MMAPPAWLPLLPAFAAAATFALGNRRVQRVIGRSPDVFGRGGDDALNFLGRAHRGAAAACAAGLLLGAAGEGPAAVTGWAGVIAMAAGAGLLAWAQRAMGTSWRVGIDAAPTGLVTSGPFALSRNPTFLGFLLLFAGAALAAPGPLTAVALGAALVSFPAQVRLEEAHLAALHGDAWRAYAARIRRWFGRVQRRVPA